MSTTTKKSTTKVNATSAVVASTATTSIPVPAEKLRAGSMADTLVKLGDRLKAGQKFKGLDKKLFDEANNLNYSLYVDAVEEMQRILYDEVSKPGTLDSARVDERLRKVLDLLALSTSEIDSVQKSMGTYNALIPRKVKQVLTDEGQEIYKEIKEDFLEAISDKQKAVNELESVIESDTAALNLLVTEKISKSITDKLTAHIQEKQSELDRAKKELEKTEKLAKLERKSSMEELANTAGAYETALFTQSAKAAFRTSFEMVLVCRFNGITESGEFQKKDIWTEKANIRLWENAVKYHVDKKAMQAFKAANDVEGLRRAYNAAKKAHDEKKKAKADKALAEKK